MEWTRTVAAPAEARPSRRLIDGFLDWEDWLTFGLALGVVLGVSSSLEGSGWSRDMPALTLVGMLALLSALLLARSPLHMVLAWPAAVLIGATVVFWQTLEMVGPGDLEQRIDAIYSRFQTWFHLAFTGGISNDSLPFNVTVASLTWLGVFLFGWSIYRWHNAWLGLIPGGVALFMNLLLIDDSLPITVFLYVLFGLLLVMRTNLMTHMREWQVRGARYPPLLSLSFLHFSFWAGLFLVVAAWLAPVGPFTTPGSVDALADRFDGLGVHFVRLAGPLRGDTSATVHDFTAVLPFQGSFDLSERELLSVDVHDPLIDGPIILRGAAYDEYASGGWKAGPRRMIDAAADLVRPGILTQAGGRGRIVPVTVTVEAKSPAGTVLFSPGQPLSTDDRARLNVAPASIRSRPLYVPGGGADLTDEEVLRRWLSGNLVGVSVERDEAGRVTGAEVFRGSGPPDVLALRPRESLAEGDAYTVFGLISDIPPDDLRGASDTYPAWMLDQYGKLPDVLPARVSQLAWDVAGSEPTPYDRAKAIETYLRGIPVDYQIGETPPGRDTVDYFLFEARRGYSKYHASAMVVMLRSLDVPARLAVGFVIDRRDFDSESAVYVVEDRDAYAWVETYFPGHGWVEFNPSPERSAELRPGRRSDDAIIPLPGLDRLNGWPLRSDFPFPIGSGSPGAGSGPPGSGSSGTSLLPWIILAAAVWAIAVAGAAALGWRHSVGGLPYPQQLWEKTVRLASWAGHPPRPGQTPAGFARFLAGRFRGVPDIGLLADAYNKSRFAHRDVDTDERALLALVWTRLRGRLARGVIRRLWRRR
jgi:hypothetical protein